MEEKKEMSLIEKRAKLIGFQNQISWIASEYAKIQRRDTHVIYGWEEKLCVALYENLNSIISQIKALKLQYCLNEIYKEMIRDLQLSLSYKVENSKELSFVQEF